MEAQGTVGCSTRRELGSLPVDIGMEHFAGEPHARRLFWVMLCESDPEAEDAPLPGRIVRPENCMTGTHENHWKAQMRRRAIDRKLSTCL